MSTEITYTTLLSNVQNYLERGGSNITDPLVFAQIPFEINGAERDLMLLLKLQGELTPIVDPTGLGIGQPVIPKPDRWRETVSLNYGAGTDQNQRTQLYPRSYEWCRFYWPDDSLTNPPQFYADYDLLHWLIVPTPDINYPLEVNSYLQPVLLDQANQTNFFTTYCGNALLYRTLLRMSPFLKNDERLQIWQGLFQEQMSGLSGQDLQKILDRNAQRQRA